MQHSDSVFCFLVLQFIDGDSAILQNVTYSLADNLLIIAKILKIQEIYFFHKLKQSQGYLNIVVFFSLK